MSEETAFLAISLPPELKERIEKHARKEDRSVSAFVRRVLNQHLKQLEAAEPRKAKRTAEQVPA